MRTPSLRMIRPILAGALALSSAQSLAAGAADAAPAVQGGKDAPAPQAATMHNSRQWDFTSRINGRRYRVQMAIPETPPPAKGFPVIYVNDGGGFFGAFTDFFRLRAMGSEIEPAIVVGISYPDTSIDESLRLRFADLTPSQPAADDTMTQGLAGAKKAPTTYGGAEAFFKVIQAEIKPQVAALAKVDAGRDILYGHSLGGLFAIYTLFNHPTAFHTFIASSPSIWWDTRAVLKNEAEFSRQVVAGKVAPRVFMLVGGAEQDLPKPPYPPGLTREILEKGNRESAMIDNVNSLAARLQALAGPPGYAVVSKVYAGKTHMSVLYPSFNDFAEFALPGAGL